MADGRPDHPVADPQALGLTIPMALLVGLLIGLGRLSADREAVALLACGVSPYRLLRPVLLMAAVATAATAVRDDQAIPDANQTFREITFESSQEGRKRHPAAGVLPGISRLGAVSARRADPGEPGWKDVLVADTSKPESTEICLAARGRLVLEPRQAAGRPGPDRRHQLPTRRTGRDEIYRFPQQT